MVCKGQFFSDIAALKKIRIYINVKNIVDAYVTLIYLIIIIISIIRYN